MSESGYDDCNPVFLTAYDRTRQGVKGVVRVAQPAAGNDWSQAVPGGEQWRVLAGEAALLTSATVANRTPRFRITDGTDAVFESSAPTQVTAGTSVRVSLQPQVASQSATQGIWSLILGIPLLWLPPGYVIASVTELIQATDQYSSIRLFVERAFEVDTDLTDEHYRRAEAYKALASREAIR